MEGLTDRELRAWRTSFQMLESLRNRIEQHLQTANGLSNADYSVLVVLSESPDGRMRAFELGQAADWEKSRMHHHISRMCSRGLVSREPNGSRGTDVVLTDAGRTALRIAVPSHAQEVRRLFVDALTPDELDRFAELAGTVLAHLRTDRSSD